jgi:hypothetical protein
MTLSLTETLTRLVAALATAAALVWCLPGWVASVDPSLDEAAAYIASQYRTGDLVVLAGSARSYELERMGELPAIAADTLPYEAFRAQRVFVLGAGTSAVSLARTLDHKGFLLWQQQFGSEEISLFRIAAPVTVLRDFTADLSGVTVSVRKEGKERPCSLVGDRYICGKESWQQIHRVVETIGGEPLECIWSHPLPGAELLITLPEVQGATHLVGWMAQSDYAASLPTGAAIEFEISAVSLYRRFVSQRTTGRQEISQPLTGAAPGPVQLKVRSSDTGARHFCWSLAAVVQREDHR